MDGEYHKFRDYVKQKIIGYGGQGTCFCATDRRSEKTFAYKEICQSKDDRNPPDDTKLLAECAMMSQINHDNVVVFLGAVREDMSKVKLFMEFAECELSLSLCMCIPHDTCFFLPTLIYLPLCSLTPSSLTLSTFTTCPFLSHQMAAFIVRSQKKNTFRLTRC